MNSKGQTKENIEPLHLFVADKLDQDEHRQTTVLFEYKMLQMYGPLLGIYAVPNLDDCLLWNCIVFVRRGFYKDAKFKFDMTFPAEFPSSPPTIRFVSAVYHPLVHETQGTVDFSELFPEQWNYANENMLFNVLSGIEKMFTEKSRLEVRTSFNPEAAKLLASRPHAFIEKTLQCVNISLDNLYVNAPNTSLIIKEYEKQEIAPYKAKLEELCQTNRTPQEKRKQFLSYLLQE